MSTHIEEDEVECTLCGGKHRVEVELNEGWVISRDEADQSIEHIERVFNCPEKGKPYKASIPVKRIPNFKSEAFIIPSTEGNIGVSKPTPEPKSGNVVTRAPENTNIITKDFKGGKVDR